MMIIETFLKTALPKSISLGSPSSEVRKRIAQKSLLLLVSTLIIFLITFAISAARFTPETRSLNLHPAILLVLLWGFGSALAYYIFDKKKHVYWLLPGIVTGGGIFLGLLSFAVELVFPGIVLWANLGLLSTLIGVNLVRVLGIAKDGSKLNLELYNFAFSIMSALASTAIFRSIASLIGANFLLFSYETWTMVLCGGAFILLSILAVVHDHVLDSLAANCPPEDEIHYAATELYISYMIYVYILLIFAIFRVEDRER
jgi:hypothetical protein